MSRFVCCLAILGLLGPAFTPVANAEDIFLQEKRPFNLDDYNKKVLQQEDPPATPKPKELEDTEIGIRKGVYKLTEHERQIRPGQIDLAYKECSVLMQMVYSPEVKYPALQQAFAKKMVEELDTVSKPKEQHPIARVNAVRLLARLAELSGAEETADLAAKVITDPNQVDGSRYWAFRTLKILFSRATKPISAARREKAVEALVQFIERPVKNITSTEERDGACVVRREAIRALAVIHDPGVANKRGAEVAWTLLRVLHRDKDLVPEPRLDERVEAAIGLSNLRPDAKGDYQPLAAAYNVGQFVVEFFPKWRGARADKHEPWKIHAGQMEEALVGLSAAVPDETIKKIVREAVISLQGVQQGKESPTAEGLNKLLQGLPPSPPLYKSNPKATLSPRES